MTSRRKFIRNASLASGLALSSSPSAFGILTHKTDDNPIVGHGDFTYKVDKKWGFKIPVSFRSKIAMKW